MQVRQFHVSPDLPERISRLLELSQNLWWSWHPDAADLFERADENAFAESNHNPVRVISGLTAPELTALAADPSFLAHYDRVCDAFDQYRTRPRSFAEKHGLKPPRCLGYFSAEFGLHECMPIYSGGLGVLAGDTLKSASDLGIPLVAVGLAYRFGYFEQHINRDGHQREHYPESNFSRMPMTLVRHDDGQPITIRVDMASRVVQAKIWRVDVGRVPLFLLDSNILGEPAENRRITARLYDGDSQMRLEQEILLGMGGIHALHAMGIQPDGYHMNEGHSAFLTLEQTARLMETRGLAFDDAHRLAAAVNVFTTHTPVPAGHDKFEAPLALEYLAPLQERLGISDDQLLGLGQEKDTSEPFSMTVLGLKMSRHRNAVSKLHGEVTRSMWTTLWPHLQENEIPIESVTNGVHTGTWLAADVRRQFDRYLSPDWSRTPGERSVWHATKNIPDSELWRSRCRQRQRLVNEIRRRVRNQVLRRGATPEQLRDAENILDPEVLTIGFCRRFATYKRATLLLHDRERLARIMAHTQRPLQFIFAGKAHPKDSPAKEYIRQIVELSWENSFRGRIVFVEGYDMGLARAMVQGVDVWLNTPRRPFEASGTSGMKVGLNGGLNLSILDGWWCEAFHGDNGWAIGDETQLAADDTQDAIDALALYNHLENEVAPRFYSRDRDGTPRGWTAMMKASLASVGGFFSTDRMLSEYGERFYVSAFRAHEELSSNEHEMLRSLTSWWERLNEHWNQVRIVDVEADLAAERKTGEKIPVDIHVESGPIEPTDLAVEIMHGPTDGDGRIVRATLESTELRQSNEGRHQFHGDLPCRESGRLGMAVRIRPARRGSELLFDSSPVVWE